MKSKKDPTEAPETTFLNTLHEEMAALTEADLVSPPMPVEARDHIVSELLGTEAKKLIVLAIRWRRAAAIEEAHAAHAMSEAEFDEHQAEASRLSEQAACARAAFWITVKNRLKLWGQSSVGLRFNWNIVRTDEPSADESFDNFLKILLKQIKDGPVAPVGKPFGKEM